MSPEETSDLNKLFYPKNVAIVGSSPKRGFIWSSGNAYISGCIKQSFQGKLFPVHPKAKSILGFKCYKNIREIPEEIDLVIFCIPSSAALEVMEDCGKKRVKFVHLLTAGFSETGRDEHADMERQLVEAAKKYGIRIVGPNCMGLYCPEGGLSWNGEMPDKIGKVGLFSQSGQLANMIVMACAPQDIFFSKVVSFGNACDIQPHEYLSYMAADEKTDIICAYLEGVKYGREFFEEAKKITRIKPLIVWKGGQTEGGSRATQSHTAAMAGSIRIWEAMCKQAGIISVNSLNEMAHTVSALKRMSLPKGTNVAILGGAGGGSVTMTDIAEKQGLRVPHLEEKTIKSLEEFVPLQGSSAKNPLDILPHLRSPESFQKLMTLLKEDSNIDALIFAINIGFFYRDTGRTGVNLYLRMILKSMEHLKKPVFLVCETFKNFELMALQYDSDEWLAKHNVATFSSFESAAITLINLKQYSDFLNNSGTEK